MQIKTKFQHHAATIILGGIFLFFATTQGAAALSSGGIGGLPANPDPAIRLSNSWFIYNLDAGESKSDALLLKNSSDEIKSVLVYAVDSIPSNQGGFALAAIDAPKEGVGIWVDLPSQEVTLQPDEDRWLPFTITIPENVDVGEYSGGIIIQNIAADLVAGEGPISASVVTRVGIRIYETVPGDIVRDIDLVDFRVELNEEEADSYYAVTLTVQNNSNISLEPTASLNITGWGKTQYLPQSEEARGLVIDLNGLTDFFEGEQLSGKWQVLRGQRADKHWRWTQPKFGTYNFQATVTYEGDDGDEQLITDVVTVTVIPWDILLIFGSIAGFLLFFVLMLHAIHSTRSWKTYTVQEGDQLATIAQRGGISWKKLAKVNKLKDPFVSAGYELRVPWKFFGSKKEAKEVKQEAKEAPVAKSAPKSQWQTYTVQEGDQLVTIAKRAGMEWKELAKLNKLEEPFIEPGQELTVPASFIFETIASEKPKSSPKKKRTSAARKSAAHTIVVRGEETDEELPDTDENKITKRKSKLDL